MARNHCSHGHRPEAAHFSTLMCDLLPTEIPTDSFEKRVKRLRLTKDLENKIISAERQQFGRIKKNRKRPFLTIEDEKELASETLLLRHKFSTILLENALFRQAVLSVIQDLYLFKQRRIFFSHQNPATDYERQDALLLFSAPPGKARLKLVHTLQHRIIAKVWQRIINTGEPQLFNSLPFQNLLRIVEDLNTIRNSYMLLTLGLVHKLAANISTIYKSSLSFEDAVQVGCLGVARASYRYHQSCGTRFSTFAGRWVMKEIQRQSLKGRLIKISAASIDRYSRGHYGSPEEQSDSHNEIERKTAVFLIDATPQDMPNSWQDGVDNPVTEVECQQQQERVRIAIDSVLSSLDQDIIKRRFGLPPYPPSPQSVISIAKTYGVTRSSIYQREQKALAALKKHLLNKDLCLT